MKQVTEALLKKYGLQVEPGKSHLECPICGHKSLSITPDNTLAKCFHPNCGKVVASSNSYGPPSAVDWVFRSMLVDCRQELLFQKGKPRRNAFNYLTKTRKVHLDAVSQSLIGAIPQSYSIENYVEKALADVPQSKKTDKAAKLKLQEVFSGLSDLLKKCPGWIIFFYEDSTGRLSSVKMRKPYDKKILTKKPFAGAGVFIARSGETKKTDSGRLLVVEGEFNALSYESLAVRYRDKTGLGLQLDEFVASAVGGVTTADWETVVGIDKNPIVCYDNDSSEAGLGLVKRGQAYATFHAFTTPESDSDLDSYIREYGKDIRSAKEGLDALFLTKRLFERSYAGLAFQIDDIRKSKKLKSFEIFRSVTEVVISDLRERARLLHDGHEGYIFLNGLKTLVAVRFDDPDLRLLISRYGINPTESLFKYIHEAISLETMDHGERTAIHRYAYYDIRTNVLYIHNGRQSVLRISEKAVETIDNGQYGVLFLDDQDAEPFKIVPVPPDRSPLAEHIFSRFNFTDGLLPNDSACLLLLFWFYSLFFENLLSTKPILTIFGPKGSGKTSSLMAIGLLLKGEKFGVTPLSHDERDFDAAITNSYYVVLDNADSTPKWLNDRLATSATGGSIKRRELYTTNKLVEFVVKCYIAITARTPGFRRDDVADRLLILRVDRYEKFKSENVLRQDIIDNRDLIMSEVVQHLQAILVALKNHPPDVDVGAFRMADFAQFAFRISQEYGIADKLKTLLKTVSREQSLFTLENDTLVDLITLWAQANPGTEVTAHQLCHELTKIAVKHDIDFRYAKSPKGLAQRLHNMRSDLEEFVDIERDIIEFCGLR